MKHTRIHASSYNIMFGREAGGRGWGDKYGIVILNYFTCSSFFFQIEI